MHTDTYAESNNPGQFAPARVHQHMLYGLCVRTDGWTGRKGGRKGEGAKGGHPHHGRKAGSQSRVAKGHPPTAQRHGAKKARRKGDTHPCGFRRGHPSPSAGPEGDTHRQRQGSSSRGQRQGVSARGHPQNWQGSAPGDTHGTGNGWPGDSHCRLPPVIRCRAAAGLTPCVGLAGCRRRPGRGGEPQGRSRSTPDGVPEPHGLLSRHEIPRSPTGARAVGWHPRAVRSRTIRP